MTDDLYEIHISYYRGPVVALRSFEPYAQDSFTRLVNSIQDKTVKAVIINLSSTSQAAITRIDDIATVVVLPAFDERILAVTQEHQRKAQEAANEVLPQRPPGSSLS